ncbi:MAG: hypothetical protein QOJ51_7157 [Acidobacteriaceae bacterium]|nr:hypothetical protein [Acidobacteriaceae bacterium]
MKELHSRKSLPENYLSASVHPYQMKRRVAQINTQREQLDGTPPLYPALGATRKASGPSSIRVELGIVDLDSSELKFLPVRC